MTIEPEKNDGEGAVAETSLERAARVGRAAAAVGFDWPDALGALQKVAEEVGELREAVDGGSADEQLEELGDLLFATTSVARLLDLDPEAALRAATDKFERRYAIMTRAIAAENRQMADMSIEELEEFWQRAKRR